MFYKLARWFWLSDKGASLVEYVLIVLLIAILGFVAVENFGQNVGNSYSRIASEMTRASGS